GEIMRCGRELLESSRLFLGPNTESFEAEFAAYCQSRFCIGVANGTDALHLALRAAGIGDGDEVITVSHTFIAAIEAIAQVGARPVLVDIDPRTMTMDLDQVEPRITDRTRAIVPVHLSGRLGSMAPLMGIARRHRLTVIEDASQAHGAVAADGVPAGGAGH